MGCHKEEVYFAGRLSFPFVWIVRPLLCPSLLRIASPSLLAPASTMFRLLLSVGLLVSCANGFAPAVGLPRNAVAAKTLLGTGAQRLLSTAKELASPHTAASASKRSLLSLPFGGPQQQQVDYVCSILPPAVMHFFSKRTAKFILCLQ